MDLNRDQVDDADQMAKWLGTRAWNFLTCTWRTLCRLALGLKTLLASGALLLLGLADELSGVDLTSYAQTFFSEEQAMRVGKWLMIAGVLFGILRLLTRGPVKFGSRVDDPEAEA